MPLAERETFSQHKKIFCLRAGADQLLAEAHGSYGSYHCEGFQGGSPAWEGSCGTGNFVHSDRLTPQNWQERLATTILGSRNRRGRNMHSIFVALHTPIHAMLMRCSCHAHAMLMPCSWASSLDLGSAGSSSRNRTYQFPRTARAAQSSMSPCQTATHPSSEIVSKHWQQLRTGCSFIPVFCHREV